MKNLRRSFLLTLAVVLSLSGFPGKATGGEFPRNVPEGKYISGDVTLNWHLVKLPTRPNVIQKILIVRPETKPKGALILFPGGGGANVIKKRGKGGYRINRNFLVRSAYLFARAGFAGVIVDAPSDYSGGMSDEFRQSKEHMKDVTKIVDHLAKQGFENILLVGTSRGTLSVGYLSTAMKDSRIKGVVFTSSMDDIVFFPLGKILYPTLFVHHLSDGCFVTEYGGAVSNYQKLASSPRKHFLSVSGGDTPQSRACGALSEHGYLGIEKEVVQAIADWSAGKAIPAQINP